MDQLCIDQSGRKKNGVSDKDKGIPKMKHYYTRAGVTLIAINGKIGQKVNDPSKVLEEIKNSSCGWFKRS